MKKIIWHGHKVNQEDKKNDQFGELASCNDEKKKNDGLGNKEIRKHE
jgi:hypothetical protein